MLTIIATLVLGAPAKLGIGDRAPALNYEPIKGNPVLSFSKTKATVVEFWATWCGPCIQNMPHISQMWAKYRDRFDFVGVSVLEQDYTKVRPFVESMGEKLAYPVAVDKLDKAGKGFMSKNWLEAAGQNGIPVAFIVDREAKIAWIGHPYYMEDVLAKVAAGTWDAKAFKVAFDKKTKDETASANLVNEAYSRIGSTVRKHSYAETLAWIKANRSKYDGPEAKDALDIFQRLFEAFSKADYENALQQAEIQPSNGLVWTYFRPTLLIARIDALQGLKKDWRGLAKSTVEGPPDPNILMALGDALSLPDSKLAEKDPDLALRVGEKLASMAREPMFLIRLAWAHYGKGEFGKAKAVLDEAFSKMEEHKRRNPQSYDNMLRQLNEAKSHFASKREPPPGNHVVGSLRSETHAF